MKEKRLESREHREEKRRKREKKSGKMRKKKLKYAGRKWFFNFLKSNSSFSQGRSCICP